MNELHSLMIVYYSDVTTIWNIKNQTTTQKLLRFFYWLTPCFLNKCSCYLSFFFNSNSQSSTLKRLLGQSRRKFLIINRISLSMYQKLMFGWRVLWSFNLFLFLTLLINLVVFNPSYLSLIVKLPALKCLLEP